MRRLVALAVAGVAVAVPVGCCTQSCPGDYPLVRQDQLSERSERSERSEDVRRVGDLHPRLADVPPGTTPVRIHGDIQ